MNDIPNFIQVDGQTALGGQPTPEQFEAARAAGYTAVVNLAPTAAAESALPDEAALLGELGLEYHHIPVAWAEPKLADFAQFVAAMDGLRGRPTLIHCAANYRVTAFYSLYAMRRLGWSAEQADALMDRVWNSGTTPMSQAWTSLISEARARMRDEGDVGG